jgi:hypothetical protein
MWAIVQGSELQVLSDAGSARGLAQIQVAGETILASDAEGRVTRVMPNGSIEREAGSTRWGP